MIARDLISGILPCLRTSDTGRKAIEWMTEFKISHLPIVNNTQLLGVISEEDVIDTSHPDDPIGDHTLSLHRAFVQEDQHIYDIIKIFSELKLTLLPVVNKESEYVGAILKSDLVDRFAEISAIREAGGILEVEIALKDYDLSQLVRIIESNDAKILSLYTQLNPESSQVKVTVKLNIPDVSRVVSSLERFNYSVVASFVERTNISDLKERFEAFLKYLNT